MNIKEKKERVRQHFLSVRKQLDPDLIAHQNHRIRQQLFTLTELKPAKKVHCYASMSERNEADTFTIIQKLIDLDKQLYLPKMESEKRLSHHYIRSVSELKPNRWGVPEPVLDTNQGAIPVFDLIVIPMVAGDRQKNRMGYGAGFYDRFLSGRNSSVKVGLLFDEQLSEEPLPVEPIDIPLDILITGSEVIR